MRSYDTKAVRSTGLRRIRVVGVVATAALGLAACGGIHPGDAVVVGPDKITMKSVDETTKALCAYTKIPVTGQQPAQPTAGNAARREVAQWKTLNAVSKRVAKKLSVSVPQSQYSVPAAQVTTLSKGLSTTNADRVVGYVQTRQHALLLLSAIGSKTAGTAPTADPSTDQTAQQAGLKVVLAQIKKDGISVDPRIGLDFSGKTAPTATGSLSVARSAGSKATAADLTGTQRCS